MPIAPDHRWLYPIDWRELSQVVRFTRAKRCCEHCGQPHGQEVMHLGDGTWRDAERGTWRDGRGRWVRKMPSPHTFEAGQHHLTSIPSAPRLPVTRVGLASAQPSESSTWHLRSAGLDDLNRPLPQELSALSSRGG